MSKPKSVWTPNTAFTVYVILIIAAVVLIYWGLATLAGGVREFVDNNLGGWTSTFSVFGLLLIMAAVGIGVYWLHEHQSESKSQSRFYALVGALALVPLLMWLGIEWVEWSLSIIWALAIPVPLLVGGIVANRVANWVFDVPTSSEEVSTEEAGDSDPLMAV